MTPSNVHDTLSAMQDGYLTTTEAAKILGVTQGLVRRWCGQGRLGKRVGRDWILSVAEVKRFAKSGRLRPGTTGRSVKV